MAAAFRGLYLIGARARRSGIFSVGPQTSVPQSLTLGRSCEAQHKALYAVLSTQPPSPDLLLINEKAVKQMQKVCEDGSRLRITVEGGGCSGFQYLFSLDSPQSEPQEDDVYISYKGVMVVLDKDSLEYIKGSTLDYNTELIRSAFRLVENPQAENGCSCGASFSVKE